jgi:hypothetical protein
VGILKVIRKITNSQEGSERSHRDIVRAEANRTAREALAVAGSSKLLREIEISEAQYRMRLKGRGIN